MSNPHGFTDRTGDNPGGRPYDEPTVKIDKETVDAARAHVPRTDDDLGFDATAQLPTYSMPSPPPPPVNVPPASAGPPRATVLGDQDFGAAPLRRGTTDLGLLILRVSVGWLFMWHGLWKLGLWNGPGLDQMSDNMAKGGWDHPTLAAILVSASEVGGGALLILGLAAPIGAAALLGVAIDAWLIRQSAAPGLQFAAPGGVEYESILIAASAALILTGPGRYSLDGKRGWATRPMFGSLLLLLVAVGAAAATWIFLHGGNPFV